MLQLENTVKVRILRNWRIFVQLFAAECRTAFTAQCEHAAPRWCNLHLPASRSDFGPQFPLSGYPPGRRFLRTALTHPAPPVTRRWRGSASPAVASKQHPLRERSRWVTRGGFAGDGPSLARVRESLMVSGSSTRASSGRTSALSSHFSRFCSPWHAQCVQHGMCIPRVVFCPPSR
ncbi:hypothetical protein BKA93DRAFT_148425 [Sparassis latifolia]